jgi:hypothetical protein
MDNMSFQHLSYFDLRPAECGIYGHEYPDSDFNVEKREMIQHYRDQLTDSLSTYFEDTSNLDEFIQRINLHRKVKRKTMLKDKIPREMRPFVFHLIDKYIYWRDMTYFKWFS